MRKSPSGLPKYSSIRALSQSIECCVRLTPGQGSKPSPVNKYLPRHRLAFRTKEDIVASYSFPPDCCSAFWARLSLPVPDLHVVANLHVDRLAGLLDFDDSPSHDRDNRLVEAVELFSSQLSNKCLWMNACIKQDLVRVRIADACKNGVVIDHDAHLLSGVLPGEFTKF